MEVLPGGSLEREGASRHQGQVFTDRKRSLRRLYFYTCLSVILFTGGRAWWWWWVACMAGGVCGWGHAWQGGVHGRGVCMAGGVARGMHGRRCAWQGACMAGGVHGGGLCMAGGMCGRGVCMAGGVCGRGHVWLGECAWQGAYMAGAVHGRGVCGQEACVAWGHACHACPPGHYETRSVNARAVRILMECILVGEVFTSPLPLNPSFLEDISHFSGATDTPVLDFWCRLSWVLKLGYILSFACVIACMQ